MSLNVQAMIDIVDTDIAKEISKPLAVFLVSINDWRASPTTFDGYVHEIEGIIGGVATKSSLEKFLMRCNFKSRAWEAESITGLLDIYQYYDEHSSLRFIVADLEAKLGSGTDIGRIK